MSIFICECGFKFGYISEEFQIVSQTQNKRRCHEYLNVCLWFLILDMIGDTLILVLLFIMLRCQEQRFYKKAHTERKKSVKSTVNVLLD